VVKQRLGSAGLVPGFRIHPGWGLIPNRGPPAAGREHRRACAESCWEVLFDNRGACNCRRLRKAPGVVRNRRGQPDLLPVSSRTASCSLRSPWRLARHVLAWFDAGDATTACTPTFSKALLDLFARTFSPVQVAAEIFARLNPLARQPEHRRQLTGSRVGRYRIPMLLHRDLRADHLSKPTAVIRLRWGFTDLRARSAVCSTWPIGQPPFFLAGVGLGESACSAALTYFPSWMQTVRMLGNRSAMALISAGARQ